MSFRFVLLIAAVAAGALLLVAAGREIGPIETAETAGLRFAAVERSSLSAAPSPSEQVARGEYLVTVGGCNDCHTPWVMGPEGPEPDPTRMLSGHPVDLEMPPAPAAAGPWLWSGAGTNTAFAGPWGVSFAANLTPEENTGTGIWTEEIFIQTLRTGRHWGQARPLLPPMPWFNYGKMTDEDLRAVFAYLRSIPPVYNPVPLPVPPAPVTMAAAP
jgi:mono/diheme cytochrome c family protein